MKVPFKLPQKLEQRNRVVGLLIGLGLPVIFSVLYLLGALDTFQNFDLDQKFRIRYSLQNKNVTPKIKTSDDIIFVDIDDSTLAWEDTFPDDPKYYVPILKKLGAPPKDKKNQDTLDPSVGAAAVVFTFPYARDYGRRVDPSNGQWFIEQLDSATNYVARLVNGKRDMLTMFEQIAGRLQTGETPPDAAAQVQQLLNSDYIKYLEFQGDGGSETPAIMDVDKYLAVMQDLDLYELAPHREELLAAAMKSAKNCFMVYEGQSYLDTPYGINDMLHNQRVYDQLVRILNSPTRNRPETKFGGQVFDAYQNLGEKELSQLLRGGNLFGENIIERIKQDREEKIAQHKEFVRQNRETGFDVPKDVWRNFAKIRHIIPAHPMLGRLAGGQGMGRAEFTKSDGTLRLIAPAYEYHNKVYPHIDLLLAMKYLGVKEKDVIFRKDKIILKNAKHPRTGVVRDVVIPLRQGGTMLINWTGIWSDTTTFEHRSLQDVYRVVFKLRMYRIWKKYQELKDDPDARGEFLAGISKEERELLSLYVAYNDYNNLPPEEKKAKAEQYKSMLETAQGFVVSEKEAKEELIPKSNELKGKIILIGRTAIGTAEINPMPLEPRYHYVGLHANAINTIIENLFIHSMSPWLVVAIFFVLAVSLGYTGGAIHTRSSVITALITFTIMIAVAIIYSTACAAAFIYKNIDIPTLVPVAVVVLTSLLVFLYRFLTEEIEKNRMKGMFSTYVNAEVVDSLLKDPDKLKLGGEWVECAVFFSDVAGFTSISESLKPEELVELLNEYLTAMTDIVFQYGGTLDKYIGDAIVAIYGAPISFPENDYAVRACFSAIDMQVKLAEMRAVWKEQGRHELTARCGVNTGRMIAGNMGSTKRFNYTVMGEECEMGEHLESGGKTWGTFMSISEETKRQAGDAIITRWVDIIPHGAHVIRVYELVGKSADGIPDEKRKGIEIFERALDLFFHRKWDEALNLFNEVYNYIPDDGPSKMIIKRCEKCKANPPGPEFDELLTKLHHE